MGKPAYIILERSLIKPVYKNRNQTNLWENCCTENTAKDNQSVATPVEHHTGLTDTERKVIEHRPAVSEIVKEITKASKEDMMRRKEREDMFHNKLLRMKQGKSMKKYWQ